MSEEVNNNKKGSENALWAMHDKLSEIKKLLENVVILMDYMHCIMKSDNSSLKEIASDTGWIDKKLWDIKKAVIKERLSEKTNDPTEN